LIGDVRRLVKEIIDAKDGDAYNIMKQTELIGCKYPLEDSVTKCSEKTVVLGRIGLLTTPLGFFFLLI
jgi:hypothetical protein